MGVDEALRLVALVLLSAGAGEGIIEFVPIPILNLFVPDTEGNRPLRTVVINLLSAVLGVGIALNFELSMFTMLGSSGEVTVVGRIITGMLIGRGSNYIHNFVKRFVIKTEQEAFELDYAKGMVVEEELC